MTSPKTMSSLHALSPSPSIRGRRGMRTFLGTLLVIALTAVPGVGDAADAGNAGATRRVAIEYHDLTGTQPMSSAPWVAHIKGFHLWEVGKPASVPVEVLAESGNPEYILGEALTDKATFGDFTVGLPAKPGGTRTVELSVDAAHPIVSGGWMLVATNDGFTGLDGINAYDLTAQQTFEVYALDAGTEVNTESKADVLGGLGHVAEHGVVHRHTGIRGDVDIAKSYAFDPAKPVGRVTIRPLEQGSD